MCVAGNTLGETTSLAFLEIAGMCGGGRVSQELLRDANMKSTLVSISDANSIIVGAASLEQSLLVIASAVLIEKALNIFLYQHLTSAG